LGRKIWKKREPFVAQTIAVEITGDGKIHVEYGGFVGNACYQEAEQLKVFLKSYGVEVEVIRQDPKRDEVEVRKLENQTSVGSGG